MSEPVKLNTNRGPDWMGRLIQASTFAGREPTPRRFHVPDLLPARTVTLLAGDGGMGKSTLALQLCAATILGKAWIGLSPAQGAALYLSAEDDSEELERRIHDAAHFYDCDKAELDRLFLLPLADDDALLATEGERGALRATPAWSAFVDLAEQVRPALIVLDSLADVFGGNEINRAHARQFVGMLRGLAIRADATVLLLAHPSLSGMSNGSGSSGSTHWNNAARSRLYLAKPQAEDEPDPDLRVLSLKKANYARALPDMRLRRQIGGYVAEGGDNELTRDRIALQARAERTFLTLLSAYSAESRHVRHTTGHSYAPAVFAKDPRAEGLGRQALQAAMNRLFVEKAITSESYGPPSRRYQRIVRTGASE
jgi:RecA-family ATPase